MEIIVKKSDAKNKKYMVLIDGNKIHFGDSRYEDFTTHKDEVRKQRYIKRHEKREEHLWNKEGIKTPSFWSRYLLWEKDNLKGAIEHINKKFNVNAHNDI